VSRLAIACVVASAVGLAACGAGAKNTTTQGARTWAVTVANNLGGPEQVAEAVALSESHGQKGSCRGAKAKAAPTPACVYQAALDGCHAGQRVQQGGSYAFGAEMGSTKLRNVFLRALIRCRGPVHTTKQDAVKALDQALCAGHEGNCHPATRVRLRDESGTPNP
jgi:hypothetical protein